jgi:hypothetical protein
MFFESRRDFFNSLLAGRVRFNSLLSSFSRLAAGFQFVRVGEVAAFFNSNPSSIRRSRWGKRLSWSRVSQFVHALVSIHASHRRTRLTPHHFSTSQVNSRARQSDNVCSLRSEECQFARLSVLCSSRATGVRVSSHSVAGPRAIPDAHAGAVANATMPRHRAATRPVSERAARRPFATARALRRVSRFGHRGCNSPVLVGLQFWRAVRDGKLGASRLGGLLALRRSQDSAP